MATAQSLLVLLLAAFAAVLALPARPALGASFVVNTNADDPGIALQCSGAPGDCSLRGAITRANLSTESDVITFGASGTITIASTLPGLTGGGDTIDGTGASVTIDATGEDRTPLCLPLDSNNNTVRNLQFTDCQFGVIIVSGSGNTVGPGNLFFDNNAGVGTSASASGNTIVGNRFGTDATGTSTPADYANQTGVNIAGDNNTVGGVTAADRNLISNGSTQGIVIGNAATGNMVYGNYIGTDVTGTMDFGNFTFGVRVAGAGNFIGGTSAGQGNIISGNSSYNVYLSGDSADGNLVAGNIIGPDINGSGANMINIYGVQLTGSPDNNVIGPGNIISDNDHGIEIDGNGNVIKGNFIGTDATGVSVVPNTFRGVYISSSGNTVGGTTPGDGNVIAFNGAAGVVIEAGTGNTVRGNSIHSNGGLGIDNTSGGNGEPGHAPPLITAVGSASGVACGGCTVDIYSDSADEGRVYHGSTVTDVGGSWSFSGPVIGPNVTATATDSAGNTTEFSAPFACSGPADTDGDTLCNSGDNCPTAANTNQADFDGDGQGDACDTEDDDDGFSDDAEAGAPLCANALDDDADGTANDGCPGGPGEVGPFSEAQFNIGTGSLDPCGDTGWPADLFGGALSTNKLTIQDISSFVAPVRRLDQSPGDANFSSRWDLLPGKGILAKFVNIQDITALVPSNLGSTARPPMFGGAPAFGQTCPYPP